VFGLVLVGFWVFVGKFGSCVLVSVGSSFFLVFLFFFLFCHFCILPVCLGAPMLFIKLS
jgi:hypothetical protein